LQSTHKEVDSRLFLHPAHAAQTGYPAVVISFEDTDVFIMALAFHTQIASKLFQKYGTKERKQIIDITIIAASDVCHGLIRMHVYTGCDTVSTFVSKGKLGALKLLRSSKAVQETFAELGQE